MIENDVREMLSRRAGDATVTPDAWEKIAERIDGDVPGPTVVKFAPPARRFNKVVMGSIAAAVLIVVASLAVVNQSDPAGQVTTTDTPSPSPATAAPATTPPPPAAPPAPGSANRPVWPATTDAELARLQADADAGRRPDLLDPQAVAGGYLSDRFADESTRRLTQQFGVGEFAQGDPSSGEVPYESPPGGSSGGTVLVRRAGREGAIWYVVGSISPKVDIKVAAYDGKELTGEATAGGKGTLSVRLSGTDGSDPVSVDPRPVTAGQPIDLRRTFAGQPGVIVQVRLVETLSGTVSFSELRVDRFPTGGPPPAPPFEAAAEAAARRWVRAVAVKDADAAYGGLAERSRDAVGRRPGFDDRFTELVEGWGAFDGAPDVSFRSVTLIEEGGQDGVPPLPTELPRLAVVIISGRVSQEGVTSFKTVSLPVRGTGEKAEVDPFVETGLGINFEIPDGSRIGRGSILAAAVPAGARARFVLDDRAPAAPDTSEGADGDQQLVTITPAPALSSGQHSVTVAVLTVDGRFFTRSVTYTVT